MNTKKYFYLDFYTSVEKLNHVIAKGVIPCLINGGIIEVGKNSPESVAPLLHPKIPINHE